MRQPSSKPSTKESESMSTFKITSRFTEAAALVNRIPAEKFPLLLSRILPKLHVKDGHPFTEAEQEQLRALFSCTEEELRTVLEASAYIFEQAAYQGMAAEPLYEFLLEAGFDDVHAKAFGRLWNSECHGFIAKLREKTLGGPGVLTAVDWHLDLVLGDNNLSRTHDSTAIFNFTVEHPDKAEPENFNVEFSHEQLYGFFQQLDRIQEQLDNLSG